VQLTRRLAQPGRHLSLPNTPSVLA
jgi:hypothetical protein